MHAYAWFYLILFIGFGVALGVAVRRIPEHDPLKKKLQICLIVLAALTTSLMIAGEARIEQIAHGASLAP
jgi:hypothetical protein